MLSNRTTLLMFAGAIAFAGFGHAADVQHEGRVLLYLEDTPVLSRLVRQSPDTFLRPSDPEADNATAVNDAEFVSEGVEPIAAGVEPPVPQEFEVASLHDPDVEIDAVVDESDVQPNLTPDDGANVASQSEPDAADAEIAAAVLPDSAAVRGGTVNLEIGGRDPVADEGEIDISDVELFSPGIYELPSVEEKEEAFYDATLFSRQTPADLAAPIEGPPPAYDSEGLAGYYSGVGAAERMIFLMDVQGTEIFGLFSDSADQEFAIRGEILNPDGQARLVIFGNGPVGVLDVQLTNLGLSSVYVPLDEEGAPEIGRRRSYDFVRILSPQARRALAELRLANAERWEQAIRDREALDASRRMRFPGDDSSFD